MSSISFGILTISDTCSENKDQDKSGPALEYLIKDERSEVQNILHGEIKCKAIVPDDEFIIMKTLVDWSDKIRVNIILTTGGTGFSIRDVTPEATKKIINKEAPGITIAMLNESLKITPMAALSRSVCGIRGKTLIINMPGSSNAAKECFISIAKVLPHAVDLILDNKMSTSKTHDSMIKITSNHQHVCPHIKTKQVLKLDNVADRLRESSFPMITIEESLQILKDSVKDEIFLEKVNIWNSYGRVLGKTVHSPCDLPPFRASIKDGYAVIAKDGKGRRKVLGGLEAGHEPGIFKMIPGTCVRINTGAPVPDEATAVVQVEDTILLEKNGKEEKEIEILTNVKEGQDIRPIGSDIKKHDSILKAGIKIGAVEMGILAACGCSEISVTCVPKIGVLSTGNELQNVGEAPKPGHVYDSNKITLITMLKENGYDAIDLGIAVDQESAMISSIENALNKTDFIITTGSVSMGDRDMLKPVLKEVFKATIHFGRVNLKPGKPTTYATCTYKGVKKYFLCLPGNPVSAVVTANLYVLPLLNLLTKYNAKPIIITVKTTSKYVLDPRPEFARVTLEWSDIDPYPKAYTTGNQISSKLLSCKNANALLMLPGKCPQKTELSEGALVPAILFGCNQYLS